MRIEAVSLCFAGFIVIIVATGMLHIYQMVASFMITMIEHLFKSNLQQIAECFRDAIIIRRNLFNSEKFGCFCQ